MSKETKWFINSPAWAPDGQYLFARHHFVQQCSLGAGEIWMYHSGGAAGLQVTEKTTWQKDAGEPSVSPDGRYLYYSKDVTPSETRTWLVEHAKTRDLFRALDERNDACIVLSRVSGDTTRHGRTLFQSASKKLSRKMYR